MSLADLFANEEELRSNLSAAMLAENKANKVAADALAKRTDLAAQHLAAKVQLEAALDLPVEADVDAPSA